MKNKFILTIMFLTFTISNANASLIYNHNKSILDLYGKINSSNYFIKNSSNNNYGDHSKVNIGIFGKSKINDNITGYGRFEYSLNSNLPQIIKVNPEVNYSFVGIKFGKYGSIDYGKNKGIISDILSYTHVLPEFNSKDLSYSQYLIGSNVGVATYRNKDFFGLIDGLNFSIQHLNKDNINRDIKSKYNGDAIGLSASYNTDFGLSFIGGYSQYNKDFNYVKDKNSNKDNLNYITSAWATGVKYNINNLYLAAIYGNFHNLTKIKINNHDSYADTTKILELTAQYYYNSKIIPSIAYIEAKTENESNSINNYINKYVSLGTSFILNKNTSLYAEYNINLVNNKNNYNLRDNDILSVGLNYQF